jgi:plasmid replication initiation protein
MWITQKTIAISTSTATNGLKTSSSYSVRDIRKRFLAHSNIEEVIIVRNIDKIANLGRIIKQSNEFARNKLNLRNLMAARVLACLFSTVREDDANFQDLTVSAKSILAHTGGSDYKTLKISCDKLLHCILEQKPDDKSEFRKYRLFSAMGYEDGRVFVKFHPDIKPFLLGLRSNFMEYDLQEFLRLPSIYSQKLFEYLKSWDDCVERIEDLKAIYALLGIPEYIRANFRDFRCRILDKAHQDISKLTSLRYEWEAIQKGVGKTSPVTAIRFIFSPGRQARSQKAKQEARNREIQAERNKLFLESAKCFTGKPDCITPKKTGKCAVCYKVRALEPPEFLRDLLPEYQ